MISLARSFAAEEQPKSALSDVFAEEPVSLEVFIKDSAYLGEDWYLSPIQEHAVKHIERIYKPDLYPLMAEEFGGYWAEEIPVKNLLTLQWGKGSGKDHVCRVASLRVAYLLGCMKSPQRYFGMPEHDFIHLLNIAYNAGQAQRAFFNPLKGYVKKGWFKDKAEPQRDQILYDKNIMAISGHSDADSQEGLNILLGVADEIDAFKARGEMVGLGKKARESTTSAEGILTMLQGSAETRFPESYKRVAISYPRYQGSTIQILTDEAIADIKENGDDSMFFASGPYPTWEVNPLRKGKSDFAKSYKKDPVKAAAMFECKPARATNPVFRNPKTFLFAADVPEDLEEAKRTDTQPIRVSYKLAEVTSKKTGHKTKTWIPEFEFDEDFLPKAGANYAMHADLAITGDRAGIAMSHVEKWQERIDVVVDDEGGHHEAPTIAPVVRNDFTICFEADISAEAPDGTKHAREIQIGWARILVFELIKRGFHVVRFSYDGFQSADSMQILTLHGIESERVSTDLHPEIYKTASDLANDGRLSMPYSKLLQTELEALNKMENGKIDHPPAGSKDLSDAFAASLEGAILVGGEESADGTTMEVGAEFFATGDALAPLEGQYEMAGLGGAFALPLGMKGLGINGWE